MVRLEALDDGRQVRIGVQLAGGGAARLGVRAQLVPADLEDRVRVQVAEGAQADQLVVALATQRPVLGGGGQRPVQPGDVVVERRAGAVDRPVQPGQLPGVQDLLRGLPHLGEEARQVLRVAQLHLLPQADLGPDGPAARLVEEDAARPRGGPRCARSAPRAARRRARTARTRRRRCRRRPATGAPSGGPRPRRTAPGGRCGAPGPARTARWPTSRPDRAPRRRRGGPCPGRSRARRHPGPASPRRWSSLWIPK